MGEDLHGVPRFHKLEFPTYDGDEDPCHGSICEHFFRGQRTMEEGKVWLAAYHHTSNAHRGTVSSSGTRAFYPGLAS